MMKRVFLVLCVFAILLFFVTSEWLSRMGYGPQNSVYAEVPPPASARQLSDEEAMPPQGQTTVKGENTSTIQVRQGEAIPPVQNSVEVSSSETKALLGEEVPSNPVIDAFRTFYTQFSSQYFQPGWLHFIYREEHPSDDETGFSSEIMANGERVPSTYLQETWYRLDEAGKVIEGVFFFKDENGNVLEVTVFYDSAWHNLATGEAFPTEKAPAIRLDGHFAYKLETAYTEGGQLSQEETVLDGRIVVLFSYEKAYDSPLQLDNFPYPVSQVRGNAYVDPVSGAIQILERIFWTTSEKQFVVLRTILLEIETNVTPPDEIIAYLEEVR